MCGRCRSFSGFFLLVKNTANGLRIPICLVRNWGVQYGHCYGPKRVARRCCGQNCSQHCWKGRSWCECFSQEYLFTLMNSHVCSLNITGLTYRGYPIEDLARHCEFEEVAYLLMHNELPSGASLKEYKIRLAGYRGIARFLQSKQTSSHQKLTNAKQLTFHSSSRDTCRCVRTNSKGINLQLFIV